MVILAQMYINMEHLDNAPFTITESEINMDDPNMKRKTVHCEEAGLKAEECTEGFHGHYVRKTLK